MQIGGLTTANAGSNASVANASIIVNNTPTIAKSFAVNLGTGVTTMSLTITNNATVGGVTTLAFSDTFPSGLVVAATPARTNTCGGTVTGATAGSGAVSLANGAIAAAGGTCTITMAVTSNAQGVYNNQTSGVSSNMASVGSASNVATYIVAGMTKTFAPNTAGPGDVTRLTVTIFNPSGSTALANLQFSDTYPAGDTNTGPPAEANTFGGSTTGFRGPARNPHGVTGRYIAARVHPPPPPTLTPRAPPLP